MEAVKRKGRHSKHSEKQKKRKRRHSSSSCSSSELSDHEDSTDSSEYKRSHKSKKKTKHSHKEPKLKKRSHKKKLAHHDSMKKEKPVVAESTEVTSDRDALITPASKSRGPMTREEYEKQQSVIRRVFDPETGRHRLVKGDGEIVEEIVSRDRHKAINKLATLGDGLSFQSGLKSFNSCW